MLSPTHHRGRSRRVAERKGFRVRVDGRGRLVIPAEARRALGVEPGETLVLTRGRGRVVLETRAALVARLRRSWARRVPSVDDLLEQRRREDEGEAGQPVHRHR
jgi:AbrB family looped-hinge helix DNA binding protein